MKRAFTLIELLVVISIMAVMGTVAVGGYRAMQRGMDERGTMENVNSFLRAAYQRAQIDRLPTAVYFWNETLSSEDVSNNTLRVVGKAVAVRRGGRITDVQEGGSILIDEFADLNYKYTTTTDKSSARGDSMHLYPMDDLGQIKSSSSILRSNVGSAVVEYDLTLSFLSGVGGAVPTDGECNSSSRYGDNISGESDNGILKTYAFSVADAGGVTWERGMAYGFEFAQIQLPVGFMFGNQYSPNTSSPIKEAGTLVFTPGLNRGSGTSTGTSGRSTVQVYSLRPNANGVLEPQRVGTSEDPSKDLK